MNSPPSDTTRDPLLTPAFLVPASKTHTRSTGATGPYWLLALAVLSSLHPASCPCRQADFLLPLLRVPTLWRPRISACGLSLFSLHWLSQPLRSIYPPPPRRRVHLFFVAAVLVSHLSYLDWYGQHRSFSSRAKDAIIPSLA